MLTKCHVFRHFGFRLIGYKRKNWKKFIYSRRAQGKKHQITTILSLAAAAILCGMRGYKDISLWAQSLGNNARSRFKCRKRNGRYEVPSRSVIRNILISVNPEQLDSALNAWNAQYSSMDDSLAIDGKTMCKAIDKEGRQTS